MDSVFAFSLCYARSTSVSWRGVFAHIWCPNFYGCHTGDFSRLPSSGSQESFCSWSNGSIIIDVTQKEASMPVCCPIFCDCFQGTILYCLTLVSSGAYIHGSHRTVTKGVFLNTYHIQAWQEVTGSGTWPLRRPIS